MVCLGCCCCFLIALKLFTCHRLCFLSLTFQEMLDIMTSIYDMMGKYTYPTMQDDAPRDHVESFFQVQPSLKILISPRIKACAALPGNDWKSYCACKERWCSAAACHSSATDCLFCYSRKWTGIKMELSPLRNSLSHAKRWGGILKSNKIGFISLRRLYFRDFHSCWMLKELWAKCNLLDYWIN